MKRLTAAAWTTLLFHTLPADFGVRDVWGAKELGPQRKSVARQVAPRSGAFLLLSPAAAAKR